MAMTDRVTCLIELEHEIMIRRARQRLTLQEGLTDKAARYGRIVDKGLEQWLALHDRITVEGIARRSRMKT